MTSIQHQEDVAISEFILTEFHGLLRNPAVLRHPLTAAGAVDTIQVYRRHPRAIFKEHGGLSRSTLLEAADLRARVSPSGIDLH
ncbi:MAG: hypothetical protein KDM81_15710, partial [Verrucomicrobiae bacterium]|nr:hypothetical protein [Verrucomicrobiae bacterium]